MSGHSKWATIKRKKAKTDNQRGKVFTKLAKEIIVAAKQGGADPDGNMRLKTAIQRAKEANIPNDNIQRAVQKGAGSAGGANYEDIVYEGYGPSGVAVMIEIMTDNRNRTAGEVRHLFSRNGGNLGESGCVSWMFDKKGLIVVEKKDTLQEDDLLMAALEAGAEDMKAEEDSYEIYTASQDLDSVKESLLGQGIAVADAEITMIPQTTVSLAGKEAEQMIKLMDALEDHDDVQDVYANFDIDD